MNTPTNITREAPIPYVPDDPLISPAEAAAERRQALSTFYRDRARGLIPPPDAFNGCRPLWRVSTIRMTVSPKPTVAPEGANLAALAAEAAKKATLAAQAAMAAADAARQAAAAMAAIAA